MNIHMNRVRVYVHAVAAAGVKIEGVSKEPNGFLTDSGSMAIEEANDAGGHSGHQSGGKTTKGRSAWWMK